MTPKTKKQTKRKTPISIILIIIWMFIAVISLLFKQFNIEQLTQNKVLLGETPGLFNYYIDFIVLIAFIIFIILFFKRRENTWKYFIGFIIFLILGDIIGLIYGTLNADKIVATTELSSDFSQFILIGTIILFFIHLAFYSLVIYFMYKNRNYFKKK